MSVRRLMDTTTQSWIEAINNKDVEQLTLLAADDHKFFVEGEAPLSKCLCKKKGLWNGGVTICANFLLDLLTKWTTLKMQTSKVLPKEVEE